MTKITRKIRKMWKDKTGVSPIIAVILMVAITVVLAATIYAWVSGFGGGGGTATPAITIKQIDHGDNVSVVLTPEGIDNASYIKYRVTGGENAVWADLQFTVDGTVCTHVVDSSNTTMSGGVIAGQEFYVYYNATLPDIDVGDPVIVIDVPSNKQIYETKVTTA